MLTINDRKTFVTLRNRYFSLMQQKARQARHELSRGASTSAPQTHQRMLSDYPALQEISGLQQPGPADFERAAEIFMRHGVLG